MQAASITHNMGFDPDVYFVIVADNLIANFGDNAIHYADRALLQMQSTGDNDGYSLWKGVHNQLRRRLRALHVPAGVTVH